MSRLSSYIWKDGRCNHSDHPAHDLLAQTEWLRNNADTARRLTSAVMRAMRYMQEHSPDEIRAHMPAQYRLQDEGADVDALRATVPMLSRNGRVTPEEAQAIKNVLAVSDETVRTAQIDLSQSYTNEFVPSISPLQTRQCRSLSFRHSPACCGYRLPSKPPSLLQHRPVQSAHSQESWGEKHVGLPRKELDLIPSAGQVFLS